MRVLCILYELSVRVDVSKIIRLFIVLVIARTCIIKQQESSSKIDRRSLRSACMLYSELISECFFSIESIDLFWMMSKIIECYDMRKPSFSLRKAFYLTRYSWLKLHRWSFNFYNRNELRRRWHITTEQDIKRGMNLPHKFFQKLMYYIFYIQSSYQYGRLR